MDSSLNIKTRKMNPRR